MAEWQRAGWFEDKGTKRKQNKQKRYKYSMKREKRKKGMAHRLKEMMTREIQRQRVK